MKREDIDRIFSELSELRCRTQKEVEEARVRFLGKKGEVTALFDEFREVSKDMKKEFGRSLNELKKAVQDKIEELRNSVGGDESAAASGVDLTMPGDDFGLGSRHPVSIVRQEIVDIFRKFGYDVAEGPEIEDDYHVFGALNFPDNHPARDMQDTFFVSAGHPNPLLLRTHTSSVQVRTMEKMNVPIRVVCPGRVFRNEAISARAHCIFHQLEGLYIDEGVTFADLRQAILLFAIPLHRAFGRSRRELQHLPRQGLQHLQGYRLARDSRLRHGRPQRARSQRHRLEEVQRIRFRHGSGAHRDAQVEGQRPAPLFRKRPALPQGVRGCAGNIA